METKIKALAQHLECKQKEIERSSYDENVFEYYDNEYLVCTDEEADSLLENSLDSYLEELIYPKLTGNLANYFDDEA